ncbi:MAG: HEPN domain-containing protein, partial [Dolichospermum sp.]
LKYLSPFKWNLHDSNNENNNLMEYSLSLFTLNEMKANITKCEIFIKQFLQTKYNYQEISVNKSAFMEIILKNKESLENIFKDFIIPLQSFITLASGQANHITSLFFCLQIDGDIKRIEAISKQSIFNTQNDILNTENFLFELYDIKQDFSLILQKWFNLFDVAEDIINLYFSTIYNDKLFLENTFLSRVQALESYHRRIIDQHKSSTDEHKRRLESILENTPLEHKRWLNEELNFSHEPSLEERLRELFQLTNRTISPLINNAEDFLKTVKKIRNYLTHYNNPSDAKLMDKLFRINQVLDFMIQSCLLKELGCSDDRCAELIERNQKYQFLKGLISEQRNLNQS